MSETRVAGRYAKSLLDLSIESKFLDKVYKDIVLLSKICSENREFVLMLKSPIVKFDKKKAVISAILKGKVEKITLAFIDLICNKNRANMIPGIAIEFVREYKDYMGIQTASITTAVALDEKSLADTVSLVKKISGRDKIELTEKIDESIIGGYILKVGDKQINDSISGTLKDLRLRLVDKNFEKRFTV